MRAAIAVSTIMLTGCVSYLYSRPELACKADDGVCNAVAQSIELRRSALKLRCSRACTNPIRAMHQLHEIGPAALPYLARAFDDGEEEVARFALGAAICLGGEDEVVDWCMEARDRFRLQMCRDVLRAN